MKKKAKRILSILVSVVMLLGLSVPAMAVQGGYADTKGHWAEAAINRWSGYGIVEGYENSFNPDGSVTRAQMAAIISRALGLENIAENPFSDISESQWYSPYILKCYAAGIMLGDNGRANPDSNITREEAMTMLCRALSIEPAESVGIASFKDTGLISEWALPYVAALISRGIVNGVTSDTVEPAGDMSRSAVVTVLDRAIVQYINESGEYELTETDGLVLVAAGDVTLTGETAADILISAAAGGKAVSFKNATVNGTITTQTPSVKINSENSTIPELGGLDKDSTEPVPDKETKPDKKPSGGGSGGSGGSGSVIRNLVVTENVTGGTYNNVTIAESVGDGEVTLEGVTIKGSLTINGGGSASVKLKACQISDNSIIYILKTGGQLPRLELTQTKVGEVRVMSPAIIEATDSESEITAVEAADNVEIRGASTRVAKLTVPESAENPVTVTATAGRIASVEANAEAVISGEAVNAVAEVVAKAPVTASSTVVQKIEIPEDAGENLSVSITGDGSVDIAVNSGNGAEITGESADITVSTELETVPDGVTVGGQTITHIHKWGEPEVVEATCEMDGSKTYTCTAAGCEEPAAVKTEVILNFGHKWGNWTNVDQFMHSRVCVNDTQHIETIKHSLDTGVVTKPAECEAEGIRTYTCADCGGTVTEAIPAINHDWVAWTKLDEVYHQTVCKNNSQHIVKEEHSWNNGEITTDPTETGNGVKTYICATCSAEKTESIPATGGSSGSGGGNQPGGSTVTATLKKDNDKIIATWEGATAPAYYFEFADSAGETAAKGWTNADECYTPDLAMYLPRVAGTYSFVVYECDKEYRILDPIARIDDCAVITVAGSAAEYDMRFNTPEENVHQVIITSDVVGALRHLRAWYRDGYKLSGGAGWSNSEESFRNITVNHNAENGDVFDLRLLNAYTLNGQVINATMTPEAKTIYTESSYTETVKFVKRDGLIYLIWADDEGLTADNWYYVSNEVDNTTIGDKEWDILYAINGLTENKTLNCKVEKGTWNDKTVLYNLENAVDIVIEGNAPIVTVAGQSDGTYLITPTPNTGSGYFYHLKNADGETVAKYYTATGVVKMSPKSGDILTVQSVKAEIAADAMSVDIALSPVATVDSITYCETPIGTTIVNTPETLISELNNGGNVILIADIVSDKMIKISTGPEAYLNLNGYRIDTPLFYVTNGKDISIDGTTEGSSIGCSNGQGRIKVDVDSILNLNGGTFDFDPSEHVDTTKYVVTNNSDGTYSVAQKETVIGKPELKTDGKRIWLEATVENLFDYSGFSIWSSKSTSQYPRLTLYDGIYLDVSENTVKCYLDTIVPYTKMSSEPEYFAITLYGENGEKKFSDTGLQCVGERQYGSVHATTAVGERTASFESVNPNDTFSMDELYGAYAYTPDGAYGELISRILDMDVDATTQNKLVFKDTSGVLSRAEELKLWKVGITESQNSNVIAVEHLDYSIAPTPESIAVVERAADAQDTEGNEIWTLSYFQDGELIEGVWTTADLAQSIAPTPGDIIKVSKNDDGIIYSIETVWDFNTDIRVARVNKLTGTSADYELAAPNAALLAANGTTREEFYGGWVTSFAKNSKLFAVSDGVYTKSGIKLTRADNIYVIDATGRNLSIDTGTAGDFSYQGDALYGSGNVTILDDEGKTIDVLSAPVDTAIAQKYADHMYVRLYNGNPVDIVIVKGAPITVE